MNIVLSKYDIRKIYLAHLTKKPNIILYYPYRACSDITINAKLDFSSNKLIVPSQNIEVDLTELFRYKDQDILISIDEEGILEMYAEYRFSKYIFISNGELDYPNLIINGKYLFRKKHPIHIISDKISDRVKMFDEIVFVGSKLGYYILDYVKKSDFKSVYLYEYNSDLFKVNKFNPCSKRLYELIDNKTIELITDTILNISDNIQKTKVLVYLPPVFTKDNTHFYSWKILRLLTSILEKKGKIIIDVDIPYSRKMLDLMDSLSNKLSRLGVKVLRNEDYGFIIGYKK